MRTDFNKKMTLLFGIVYCVLSLCVIFAEYEKNIRLISFTKPFLIPVLGVLYVLLSKKINWIYLSALLFIWMANLFFINQTPEFIFKGTASYLIFWVFIIYLILINTSFPNKVPFIIAVIPFSFIYCCVFQLVYENIQTGVYFFFINGAFMIFMGAYSLANYFIDSNRSNTYFLIGALFFTFIQFLVSIDLYYVSIRLFRPIAMLLFVTAHFFLLKTMLSFENKRIATKSI